MEIVQSVHSGIETDLCVVPNALLFDLVLQVFRTI